MDAGPRLARPFLLAGVAAHRDGLIPMSVYPSRHEAQALGLPPISVAMEAEMSTSQNSPTMCSKSCPKCSGTMEGGFLLNQSYAVLRQVLWTSGTPEKGGLFGRGLRTSDRATYAVRSLRCARCGFLESYADATPLY